MTSSASCRSRTSVLARSSDARVGLASVLDERDRQIVPRCRRSGVARRERICSCRRRRPAWRRRRDLRHHRSHGEPQDPRRHEHDLAPHRRLLSRRSPDRPHPGLKLPETRLIRARRQMDFAAPGRRRSAEEHPVAFAPDTSRHEVLWAARRAIDDILAVVLRGEVDGDVAFDERPHEVVGLVAYRRCACRLPSSACRS